MFMAAIIQTGNSVGVDQLNCFVFLGDLSEIVLQSDGCIVLLVILYFCCKCTIYRPSYSKSFGHCGIVN